MLLAVFAVFSVFFVGARGIEPRIIEKHLILIT